MFDRSEVNLSKSKKTSFSKKVGTLKAAARGKFQSLKRAVSRDKGLDQPEVTICDIPLEPEVTMHDIPLEPEVTNSTAEDRVTSKPPKAKKSGLSLKKLFKKKKGSKLRSTDVISHR